MKNILYVNACVKRDVDSRTGFLAQAYLNKRLEDQDCRLTTVVLEDSELLPLSGKGLQEREKAIQTGDFSGKSFELKLEGSKSSKITEAKGIFFRFISDTSCKSSWICRQV